MNTKSTIALESGLDLKDLFTTGSMLHINEDYEETDLRSEPEKELKTIDFIGRPVASFADLEKKLVQIDATGLVKKKILDEGGGLPLHKGCTVHVAFSGYWEKESEPFDVKNIGKPLVVDLNDSGLLLPGLQMAIETMLVGEMSVFLLSYAVMYGELGIPPRIKPKADCVFYIKLLKSIITPKQAPINFSEPNMFERVYNEVRMLYSSGVTLHKNKNFSAAIQLFRKAVFNLHKCRLADENEEQKQEKMLKRLYTNLAICYNATKQPLKACIACNELNRLNNLWNNGKVLFQNAKALRMIGQFDSAETRLRRSIKLCPDRKELKDEYDLLERTRQSCNQSNLIMNKAVEQPVDIASDRFKLEVDKLIKNFKENEDLCKLTLPEGLNAAELEYIKGACDREKLFFNKIEKDYALDKDEEIEKSDEQSRDQD